MAQCFKEPDVVFGNDPNDPQFILFRKFIENSSKIDLLDFGAGKGRIGYTLNEDINVSQKTKYFAFEPDKGNYDLLNNVPNIQKVFSKAIEIPDNSFDCVLLCNVLHEIHPSEWKSSLEIIKRILKDKESPEKIKKELEALKGDILPINITNSPSQCERDSVSVCFQSNGCDINVKGTCTGQECKGDFYKNGIVEKNNTQLYYTSGLLYGAIFSSPENYQCNVKRLVRKLGYVSEVYSEKSRLSANRCNTGLQPDTLLMSKLSESYKGLNDLKIIEVQSGIIDTKNNLLGECNLY